MHLLHLDKQWVFLSLSVVPFPRRPVFVVSYKSTSVLELEISDPLTYEKIHINDTPISFAKHCCVGESLQKAVNHGQSKCKCQWLFPGSLSDREVIWKRKGVCGRSLFKILGRMAVTPSVQGQVSKLFMLFLIFCDGEMVATIHTEVNSALWLPCGRVAGIRPSRS